MSNDTNKQEKDIGMDLSTLIIWEVGIVFVVALVVMTIYLYGLYLRVQNAETERKLYTPRLAEVANTKLEQQYKVSSYSWIDHDKGLVSIPIDLAMIKTATSLNNQRRESTKTEVFSKDRSDEAAVPDGGLGSTEKHPVIE